MKFIIKDQVDQEDQDLTVLKYHMKQTLDQKDKFDFVENILPEDPHEKSRELEKVVSFAKPPIPKSHNSAVKLQKAKTLYKKSKAEYVVSQKYSQKMKHMLNSVIKDMNTANLTTLNENRSSWDTSLQKSSIIKSKNEIKKTVKKPIQFISSILKNRELKDKIVSNIVKDKSPKHVVIKQKSPR